MTRRLVRVRLLLIVVTLLAGGLVGETSAAAATVAPSLTVGTKVGPPTTVLTVSGAGFGVNELIEIHAGPTELALVGTTPTGAFSQGGVTIPASAQPGTLSVWAKGRRTGRTASSPFVVRTNWAQNGFNAQNSRFNVFENTLSANNVATLQQKWSREVNSPGVAVANGLVYATGDDTFYAFDASTGATKWKYRPITPLLSAAVSGNLVYTGAPGGGVMALDAATGARHWVSPVVPRTAIAASGGVLFFGSSDGRIYALDAATGTTKWNQFIGAARDASSAPAVADGVVYLGSNQALHAFNAYTGAEIWSFAFGTDVYSAPSAVNGMVYMANNDSLFAFSAATGELKWKNVTGNGYFNSSPGVANGYVYIGSDNYRIYAFDAISGVIKWTYLTNGPVDGSVAIANGLVYSTSFGGSVYGLDAATGAVRWHRGLGDPGYFSPVVVNGMVYATTYNGLMFTYGLPK